MNTSQANDLTRRQHQGKMTLQEDNIIGIGPHRKKNSQQYESQEDNLIVRQNHILIYLGYILAHG